jgi:hypothetical protein
MVDANANPKRIKRYGVAFGQSKFGVVDVVNDFMAWRNAAPTVNDD